jgi:hypothetical protein
MAPSLTSSLANAPVRHWLFHDIEPLGSAVPLTPNESMLEDPMSQLSVSRAAVAGVLATVSVACASTRVTPFDTATKPYPRTPPADIRFYGTTPPSCAYEEIGRVTAQSRLFVTWDRVVEAVRKTAHDLGGDAVINVQDSSHITGASVNTSGVTIDERSSLSGVVIRFRHVDCMD